MASKKTSRKQGYGPPCQQCRKKKRGCTRSEIDSQNCIKCQEAGKECSLSIFRVTPSMDAKRKLEEIGDTPERESFGLNDSSSSASTSYNLYDSPILPPLKRPRQNKSAQPAALSHSIPPGKEPNKLSDTCGICQKKRVNTGEKQGDQLMLQCDIEDCERWYHLSCILFKSEGKQIFHSLATGTETEKSMFFCMGCFNPKRKDLILAVRQAKSDFKRAMEKVKEVITVEKEGWSKKLSLSRVQEQEQDDSHTMKLSTPPLREDTPQMTDFKLADKISYRGFEGRVIEPLLASIEQAVYDYDREIAYANNLFLGENEVLKYAPLKVWGQVDSGHALLPGKNWFDIKGMANNLSESHAPITSALRRILSTPDDKPLQISPELEDLSFSQVHTALVNWFVFDLLNDELNMYCFPNMKPLKAVLSAVANFGDARWKGNGRQVLREVQLRAWHKTQFREEVIEKVGWQGDLIRLFEEFLAPLTKKIGKFDPRSESRANIIKLTIELWSYLDASDGKLEIIHPTIGEPFDRMACENVDDELHSHRIENMKVKWVLRPGFRFQERCTDGRAILAKALVIVN